MITIEYINGDLFNDDNDVIAHGCNCSGGFGSGVAGIISREFPEARANYIKKHMVGELSLGQIFFVETDSVHPEYIVNMMTQQNYGGDKTVVYVSYEAIRECFRGLFKSIDFFFSHRYETAYSEPDGEYMYATSKPITIAIPKIGSGLANGDWVEIHEIIKEVVEELSDFCSLNMVLKIYSL